MVLPIILRPGPSERRLDNGVGAEANELHIAAEQRLSHHRSAADVEKLHIQSLAAEVAVSPAPPIRDAIAPLIEL